MARRRSRRCAAEATGSEEVTVGPGDAAAWLENSNYILEGLLPDFKGAHGDDDQADVDEVEGALQLGRDGLLEVEEAEGDIARQRVRGEELLRGDVVAVEGVGWGRDGGEVFEPDSGPRGNVCDAGVCGEF